MKTTAELLAAIERTMRDTAAKIERAATLSATAIAESNRIIRAK